MNILFLMNNILKKNFWFRQIFHPMKIGITISRIFIFISKFFYRLIENLFDMIDNMLKNFMMHFWKNNSFKKWLNSSHKLKSVRSYLKYYKIANTISGIFELTTIYILFIILILFVLIHIFLFLIILLLFLNKFLFYYNIIIYKIFLLFYLI